MGGVLIQEESEWKPDKQLSMVSDSGGAFSLDPPTVGSEGQPTELGGLSLQAYPSESDSHSATRL